MKKTYVFLNIMILIQLVYSQDIQMISEKVKEVLSNTDIMEYDTFMTRYMDMNEEERCKVCMSIIVPIVEILEQSDIQNAVINGLSTSCDSIGILFRGTCKDFVNALIPPIFSILLDVLPEANCGITVGDPGTTMCNSDISYEYLEPQNNITPKTENENDPTTIGIIIAAAGFLMSIFCSSLIVYKKIYNKKNTLN